MVRERNVELEDYLDKIDLEILNTDKFGFFDEFRDEVRVLIEEHHGSQFAKEGTKWYVLNVNEDTAIHMAEKIDETDKSPHDFAIYFLGVE